MELEDRHKVFNDAERKHVLIITNHGCHNPTIRVTTDTGGQNFYVNDFAKALLKIGYKVTVLNRGGYRHPVTGDFQEGVVYYDNIWKKRGKYCRVLYLEDDDKRFVLKEQLKMKNLQQECQFFFECAERIGFDVNEIYFISSHYWDAGILGELIRKKLKNIPHVWTPHSLGMLKKENYKNSPKNVIKSFNFPSRIRFEERVLSKADGVVSTSREISDTLLRYKNQARNHFWMPPGVETNLYKPRRIEQCKRGIKVISDILEIDRKKVFDLIRNNIVFFEISRTVDTKRKDIILKAFDTMQNAEKSLMIMAVDQGTDVYDELIGIYDNMKNKDRVVIIRKFHTKKTFSQIYSLSDVFVTASVMEGWGMSVQQAAASKCAVISSRFVPFVTEILQGNAVVVDKQNAKAYSEAMDGMVEDRDLRKEIAEKVYKITSKEYSWEGLTKKLILDMRNNNLIAK